MHANGKLDSLQRVLLFKDSRVYIDGQMVDAPLVEPPGTGKASLLHRNEDAAYAEFSVDAKPLDHFFRNKF